MHQAFCPCSAIPLVIRIVPLWWLRTPSGVFFYCAPRVWSPTSHIFRLLGSEETAMHLGMASRTRFDTRARASWTSILPVQKKRSLLLSPRLLSLGYCTV